MDRRTFLKLSAGVLALAAAGGLTGCGGTTDKSVRVTIDGVDFIYEEPVIVTGGVGTKIQYKPLFAIRNNTADKVSIKPTDITGTFTDAQGNQYPMDFSNRNYILTVEPHGYGRYNGLDFGLESENTVPVKYTEGSYELRVKYNGKTAVFRCDSNGKVLTSGVE